MSHTSVQRVNRQRVEKKNKRNRTPKIQNTKYCH